VKLLKFVCTTLIPSQTLSIQQIKWFSNLNTAHCSWHYCLFSQLFYFWCRRFN